MSSPYEDDVMRLLEEKREELDKLEKKNSSELGFFGKRSLARKILAIRKEIAYLDDNVERYRNGVSWNRKTGGQNVDPVKKH